MTYNLYPVEVLIILTTMIPLSTFGEPAIAQAGTMAQPPAKSVIWQAPANGGARRWQVVGDQITLHQSASVNAKAISQHKRNSVLSNLGCSRDGNELWCKVRPFRGGVRGFTQAKSLQPALGPDGVVAMGPNDTKRRARQRDFDEKGSIRCAQERGQDFGQCGAAVARSAGGDATVVVTFPNGFARDLYFVHGEFVRASATMSGVGTDIDWQLKGELHLVRVDDQQYEIPKALVFKH